MVPLRQNCLRSFLTVAAVWCLLSCTEDDRLLTATCGQSLGRAILVKLTRTKTQIATVGVLDTPQWLPGTILELQPAGAGSQGGARVVYRLRASEADFMAPEQEDWVSEIIHPSFDFDMDDDVRRALRFSKSAVLRQIDDQTVVVAIHAKRRTLKDPLEMINHDPMATEIVRKSGMRHRFVVISAASYGTAVALEYSGYPIAKNTIRVEGYYLHLQYDCAAMVPINSKARSSGGEIPIMFVYLPIRVEAERGHVVADTAALDLSDLDLFQMPDS
jgi:hypothetical protein